MQEEAIVSNFLRLEGILGPIWLAQLSFISEGVFFLENGFREAFLVKRVVLLCLEKMFGK